MMRSSSISAILCLLAALFFLPACRERIPPVDPGWEKPEPPPVVEEDPVLKVRELGAYGVPGGEIVLRNGWQLGIMRYGGIRQNIRLVQPSQARVASLSSLPRPLQAGMQVDALYRETEQGLTRVCIPYRLEVLRVSGDTVWLKESEHTYFVLEQ